MRLAFSLALLLPSVALSLSIRGGPQGQPPAGVQGVQQVGMMMKDYGEKAQAMTNQYGSPGAPPPAAAVVQAWPNQASTGVAPPAGTKDVPSTVTGGIALSWVLCALLLGVIASGLAWYVKQRSEKGNRLTSRAHRSSATLKKPMTSREALIKAKLSRAAESAATASDGANPYLSAASGGHPSKFPVKTQLPVTVVSNETSDAIDRNVREALLKAHRGRKNRAPSDVSTSAESTSSRGSASSGRSLHPILARKAAAAADGRKVADTTRL